MDARPAKLFRSTEQHRAVESMEGMLPWNGNHDNMIDRFDGRALLDFYRDPVPSKRQRTADEQMLDEARLLVVPDVPTSSQRSDPLNCCCHLLLL